jgi:hypothetical protein
MHTTVTGEPPLLFIVLLLLEPLLQRLDLTRLTHAQHLPGSGEHVLEEDGSDRVFGILLIVQLWRRVERDVR